MGIWCIWSFIRWEALFLRAYPNSCLSRQKYLSSLFRSPVLGQSYNVQFWVVLIIFQFYYLIVNNSIFVPVNIRTILLTPLSTIYKYYGNLLCNSEANCWIRRALHMLICSWMFPIQRWYKSSENDIHIILVCLVVLKLWWTGYCIDN